MVSHASPKGCFPIKGKLIQAAIAQLTRDLCKRYFRGIPMRDIGFGLLMSTQ